jgi:hypothetical protein
VWRRQQQIQRITVASACEECDTVYLGSQAQDGNHSSCHQTIERLHRGWASVVGIQETSPAVAVDNRDIHAA